MSFSIYSLAWITSLLMLMIICSLAVCVQIKPDLSNYDENQAWPLLLDNFVEWARKGRNCWGVPSGLQMVFSYGRFMHWARKTGYGPSFMTVYRWFSEAVCSALGLILVVATGSTADLGLGEGDTISALDRSKWYRKLVKFWRVFKRLCGS